MPLPTITLAMASSSQTAPNTRTQATVQQSSTLNMPHRVIRASGTLIMLGATVPPPDDGSFPIRKVCGALMTSPGFVRNVDRAECRYRYLLCSGKIAVQTAKSQHVSTANCVLEGNLPRPACVPGQCPGTHGRRGRCQRHLRCAYGETIHALGVKWSIWLTMYSRFEFCVNRPSDGAGFTLFPDDHRMESGLRRLPMCRWTCSSLRARSQSR